MSYQLIFRTKAEFDLEDIEEYYGAIRSNLSDEFFKEFFGTLKFIEDRPDLFQERYRGIRIPPLYKFPYGIHYQKKGDKIIIYRVLHTKRYFK